jgi:GH18 family chitinase
MQPLVRRGGIVCLSFACAVMLLAAGATPSARAQQASISTWDAADFRVWAYIPYWNTSSIASLATNGSYAHVSDVLYFGAVRPDANGNLPFALGTYQTGLSTLRTHAASNGFKLHLSVFEVAEGSSAIDSTWNAIIADPTKRANFVNSAKALLQGGAGTADDLKGFNFDWERPATATQWGNYTQLARELRAAINPLGMEVSVCDYGSTDTDWDGTALFDAKVYDQLFMMVYHIGATSSGNWANTKLALTGQGAAKAFSNDQIGVGFGTYGDGVDIDGTGPIKKPATYTLSSIAAAYPNLAYDTSSISEPYLYSDGVTRTATWNIESRKQVREKTQLAFDRNMPGMFSWTLTFDATNDLGLHRVIHHYTAFKRNVPDLNLDGKVNASDATLLANNMGIATLTATGTTTAAQFEAFYQGDNWEKGDRDGDGFVNQLDADWLAGRYAALGVTLPDRLAYSGTFEGFQNSKGLSGRWAGVRDAGKIRESSNYAQHTANFLTFSGSGAGYDKHSNYAVTIRNQSTDETAAAINTLPRIMEADLSTPIDLGQNEDTYFTFLVRQNTAPLSPTQLASDNRILSLQFQNAASAVQFEFPLLGKQEQFGIKSLIDVSGEDVTAVGFAPNTTYLFVGKISGNGAGANTMQASLLPSGSVVGNFTDPSFPWMLTAHGSASFNPVVTQLQFRSLFEFNFTISNLWLGNAAAFFTPTATSMGDFNGNGTVDTADYLVWRSMMGQTGAGLAADGNGNNVVDADDYDVWRRNFGLVTGIGTEAIVNSAQSLAVPEPATFVWLVLAVIMALTARPSRI